MRKYKLIGFDLDGTLINTLPDLTLVINSTLAEANLPTATPDLVLTWIGKGADVFFANAIKWVNQPFADEQLRQLRQRFDHFYATYVCEKSELYPNVKSTLEALRANGYPLAVVTNKPTKLVQPVLQAFGIDHFFCEMLGGQSLPAIKPHPAPLYYLCGKFGLHPHEILFVGDSENDVIAAKTAGCEVVGLTYGYNYNVPIANANPTYVCEDFAEILTIVG